MEELLKEIKNKVDQLLCEAYPKVCKIRDDDYDALKQKILGVINANAYSISIQTAIAIVESELN